MSPAPRRPMRAALTAMLSLAVLIFWGNAFPASGQEAAPAESGPVAPSSDLEGAGVGDDTLEPNVVQTDGIRVWSLLRQGGWFMLPILLMSLIVVTVSIERVIALQRSRILPSSLIEELGKASQGRSTFDPRDAYRLCQRFPSSAATVIRAMLMKVGRPLSEVESTVADASQREADRLYANVRWLNLAAAVTPLMGLFGTVWGMILAFYDTTQLQAGQNKADELAEGIYLALVTTLGGLAVAIPAAILSHYFEGRIQKLFHQMEELVFNLMPQVERFEGQVRFRGEQDSNGSGQKPAGEPPRVARTP